MKKLFLLLILIPVLLSISTTAWSQEKKTAKSRKKAIAELKTLLKKYPNWQWDGKIIEANNTLNTQHLVFEYQDRDFTFPFVCISINKKEMGYLVGLEIAPSFEANWQGEMNGEKILSVEGQFSKGEKFETTLESDDNPYQWLFAKSQIKTKKGKTMNIIDELLDNQKLYLSYQTSQISALSGAKKELMLNLTGLKELVDKAKEILSLE